MAEISCHFCGSGEVLVPQAMIGWGMYGIDYQFCEECLRGMSAYEMWRQLFLDRGYAWPPMLKPKPEPTVEPAPKRVRGRNSGRVKRGDRRKRERGKMSNGLRYKVMRRDDFHCQICGATGKDARLVVDHIVPIARDGKTEMDNLRTLCHPCNSGKGVKLDDGGR